MSLDIFKEYLNTVPYDKSILTHTTDFFSQLEQYKKGIHMRYKLGIFKQPTPNTIPNSFVAHYHHISRRRKENFLALYNIIMTNDFTPSACMAIAYQDHNFARYLYLGADSVIIHTPTRLFKFGHGLPTTVDDIDSSYPHRLDFILFNLLDSISNVPLYKHSTHEADGDKNTESPSQLRYRVKEVLNIRN